MILHPVQTPSRIKSFGHFLVSWSFIFKPLLVIFSLFALWDFGQWLLKPSPIVQSLIEESKRKSVVVVSVVPVIEKPIIEKPIIESPKIEIIEQPIKKVNKPVVKKPKSFSASVFGNGEECMPLNEFFPSKGVDAFILQIDNWDYETNAWYDYIPWALTKAIGLIAMCIGLVLFIVVGVIESILVFVVYYIIFSIIMWVMGWMLFMTFFVIPAYGLFYKMTHS